VPQSAPAPSLCGVPRVAMNANFQQQRTLRALPTRSFQLRATVRAVVDTLDWLTSRTAVLAKVDSGLVRLARVEGEVPGELLMVTDKKTEEIKKYLPFLGLVDSEAWAFGRLQSTRLPDGRTVRDRFSHWQENGRAEDPVLTPADLPAIEQHPEPVRRYWEHWLNRTNGRVRLLDEDHRRGRSSQK
jgi:hypothetical protein